MENKNRLKELTYEKIKIEENPEMKKYLNNFFQNPKLYFNNKFNNKKVIIGKAKTFMERFQIPIPKRFLRRINRRGKTKTFRTNESLSEQISLFNEKRRGFKGTIESSLKAGQRYINDREIEEIFKSFQKVQEINKSKIKNFITTKEIIDSIYVYHENDEIKNKNQKNKMNNYNSLSESCRNYENNDKGQKKERKNIESSFYIKNKKKFNNNILLLLDDKSKLYSNNNLKNKLLLDDKNKLYSNNNLKNNPSKIKSNYSQYEFQYNKNILIPQIKLHNIKISKDFNDILKNNNNNNIDNYSTLNSQNTILYQSRPTSSFNKYINTKIQMKEKKEKAKIKKLILENEKLKEKQIQYLPNTNQELIKNEIAKRLASQEKALIYSAKHKNNENSLLDNLSKKLKKQKSELLLGQIEDYRLIKDIKIKINRLIKKANPGQNYNWEMDLRKSKDEDEDTSRMINNDTAIQKNSLSQNDEITRNPCYKIFSETNKKFKNLDKGYIKSKVSKKLYNKFKKEIKNLKRDFEGFLLEGKSLLKYEHDLIKKINGKKIINNYELNIQPQEINDALYAKNYDLLKFNKP